MDRTIAQRSMANRQPGLPLLIKGGQLYVIRGKEMSLRNVWPWQADNIVVYAYALRSLVSRWGSQLPDLELLIETADSPSEDGSRPEGWAEGPMPVMRHCRSATSPDILVPIFHLYTMHFEARYLAAIERTNREHPWEAKLPGAFAAGVNYHRYQNLPGTLKAWEGRHAGEKVEMVRQEFAAYVAQELARPNITYSRENVPLHEWARHKAVMHVDGITCSSRVFQLLTLGSVLLREASGYTAFYDHLLTKFIHYVPFWAQRPREVLWAANWVAANDAAARRIAERGQAFAREYLSPAAVECYWLLLLHQYSRVLTLRPGWRRGAEAGGAVPIDVWLATQEGAVEDWGPTRIAERGRELDLPA